MALKTKKTDADASKWLAPDLALPGVEIEWTKRELESLAKLASAPKANPPTEALIRALRNRPTSQIS